jgi:predicted nucleic acid-binding protein
MIYLLETNVVSEAMKPNEEVMAWIDSIPKERLWICTVVVAEVLSGLDVMPAGRRQSLLRVKAVAMFSEIFKDRIFTFDLHAARAVGPILRERKQIGRPIDSMDALIAATAVTHSATIATRNVRDFESCGVTIVNPWTEK